MRITGGAYKGQKLFAPKGSNTRPTSDAGRESLFNVIAHSFGVGVECGLDLFSGSGALSMEAFSRGMETMIVFENDKAAKDCIRKNFEQIKPRGDHELFSCSSSKIHQWDQELTKMLAKTGCEKIDVVFCDPPYERGFLQKLSQGLFAQSEFWKPDCLLYIEAGIREEAPTIAGWKLEKEKRKGASAQLYYVFQ